MFLSEWVLSNWFRVWSVGFLLFGWFAFVCFFGRVWVFLCMCWGFSLVVFGFFSLDMLGFLLDGLGLFHVFHVLMIFVGLEIAHGDPYGPKSSGSKSFSEHHNNMFFFGFFLGDNFVVTKFLKFNRSFRFSIIRKRVFFSRRDLIRF